VTYIGASGLGVVMVSVLDIGSKIRGSNLAKDGFLRAIETHTTPSF
jgi:hypothetical protein